MPSLPPLKYAKKTDAHILIYVLCSKLLWIYVVFSVHLAQICSVFSVHDGLDFFGILVSVVVTELILIQYFRLLSFSVLCLALVCCFCLLFSCARDVGLVVCARHLRCYPIHCIS